MKPRNSKTIWICRLAAVVFALNLLAVTWPLLSLFRAADPRFLGLPLSLAWPVAWIVVGWITLMVLDHFVRREDND